MKYARFYKTNNIVIALIAFSLSVSAIAPTAEEKEFQHKAKQNRIDVRDLVADLKHGWSVVEHFHKGVSLNNRVNTVLTDCWQQSYVRDDSSYSTKITEHTILSIFEQFLIEMQPGISSYNKQNAMGKMRNDAYYFGRDSQREFRETVEKGQRLILKHLKDHIPLHMRQEFENGTERIFKDGMRFLIYVLLKKHNNGFGRNDVRFINAKMEMFLNDIGKEYPYISIFKFESWIFSLLSDLMFSECVVCMDAKGQRYMSCCKTKAVCKKCYTYLSSCPLCRAPKKSKSI